MKKMFTLFLLSLFALQACKKETKGTDALTGNWQLVSVYSDSPSAVVPRPADATGSFTIAFSNNGSFSGKTFRNTFEEGSYTLTNTNEVRFGSYSATKVAEDAWGNRFNEVLISCLLQSLSPCIPSVIHVQNDELTITTPRYSTLTFKKL